MTFRIKAPEYFLFFAVQSYEVNKGLAGTNFLSSNHRLSDPTHSFQAICEQKETKDTGENQQILISCNLFEINFG